VPRNDDKRNTSASYLGFDINVASTVYVFYDTRPPSVPGWLDGSWSTNSNVVSDSNAGRDVYFKSFAPGRITLGGNARSPAAGTKSNYIVVVIPD